ncbi:MAG: iron-sulfur cluster assembly scaffold protein [Candidatus Pacearchaeota archaeon]
MDEIYKEEIIKHYKNPKNKKKINEKECECYKEDYNPFCGDRVKICLKIKNKKIEKIFFDGEGCVISQFSASVLSEKLKNKNIEEIIKIEKRDLLKMLGIKKITIARIKCAMLPLVAIKKAIIEYISKNKNLI